MKRYFTIFCFTFLICISFIIADKTANMVINNNELMVTIKEVSPNYSSLAIDGMVDGNTFIPGISGLKVNEKKSYNAMKNYGIFMSSLLSYDEISPNHKLKDNYDKYIISGNSEKKMISLIFLIHSEDNISDVFSILNNKNIKANFFVDGFWFEKNNNIISELIKNNYIIGNLSYNENYNDGAYIWMDTIIKKIGKQKNGFCYAEQENPETLRICTMNKNYTIMPNLIIKDNFLSNIRKNIQNGMIISLDVNTSLINELPVIINYIESKGYEICNLEELLNEKY